MRREDDDAIIAAARAGFLDEAQDMLSQFEQALLVMESDPEDQENLNAAFRAAHTIKGTAGLFGFDAVVSFTHEAETLLELLRSGKRPVDEHVIALMLRSRDEMERLLQEVRSGTPDPAGAAEGAALADELRAAIGATASAPAAAKPQAAAAAPAADAPHGDAWQVSLRFGGDALRNGLDPLAFIRYLDSVGVVRHIETLHAAVPSLDTLDPEHCYLGFEIRLESPGPRQIIEQVFDFCVDDCDIAILAPDAAPAEWNALAERRREGGEDEAPLRALWSAQGVSFGPAEQAPPVPSAQVPVVAHAKDAPAAQARNAAGTIIDRRAAESDRRQGSRDRRNGDEARFIKVRADKLDRLIDIIGELVIAGSGAQLVAQREASPGFLEAAARIASLVEDARDRALGLRMVPIGETFARFQRVVRDVGKALSKEVELEVTGGDTELDKAMVETIADPLMHLVRNSLDHGVETPAERSAAGKRPCARVALNAYQESGQIVIEVSDDGRGLNRDRILAKAKERGLIERDATPSDAEVHELILLPGFSTAEQVTDISGRGVGMDVVKRNIEALRGQMRIASTPGQGTTTQIRLPLTLAIIDGFLTSVGGIHCVAPLETVVECIETPHTCGATADQACGWFDLRGEVMPYIDLRRSFRLGGERPARQSMLIVRMDRTKVGLLVDRLLGQQQTVIKPLGRTFARARGIAGSSILGSGEVALVLDVAALLGDTARQRNPRGPESARPSATA